MRAKDGRKAGREGRMKGRKPVRNTITMLHFAPTGLEGTEETVRKRQNHLLLIMRDYQPSPTLAMSMEGARTLLDARTLHECKEMWMPTMDK